MDGDVKLIFTLSKGHIFLEARVFSLKIIYQEVFSHFIQMILNLPDLKWDISWFDG